MSNTRGVKFHRLRFVEEFFENDFVQTLPSFLLGRHFRIFHEYGFFVGHCLPPPTTYQLRSDCASHVGVIPGCAKVGVSRFVGHGKKEP